MKNLTEKQKHSPIKSRRFYRRQMWLPALVLIASILLLWQNAGENSHSPRPINSQCKFEDFYNPAQPYVSVNAPSLYYTGCAAYDGKKETGYYYYSLENGTWRADRDYQNDAFVLHGGGGMKSTLGDMMKYAVMYLNEGVAGNGNRIVDRYSVQEMEKPRQFMKPGIYYGYGLETKQVGDRAVYEHGGSLPGVSSNFSFCPQEEVGIVVLCNTMDVSVAAIADAALNAYCGLEVEEERQIHAERSWSAEELEELAGSYVSGEGDAFTLTVENGTLSMKVNGNPTALQAVYPWQGMVRKTYSDIYLTAIRDEEGHVFAARYGSRIFPKEA